MRRVVFSNDVDVCILALGLLFGTSRDRESCGKAAYSIARIRSRAGRPDIFTTRYTKTSQREKH
jgi:hypothetical protein